MSVAICPGSFDPITLGHVDVIRRASSMFNEVVVGVAHNARKNYMFSDVERVRLAQEALADLPNVRVELVDGLIAYFAQERHAAAIVKGLRGTADYDDEQAMALLNRHLSGIETVFIMGGTEYNHVASSFVKEIARYGGNIDSLVPASVARALKHKVAEHE